MTKKNLILGGILIILIALAYLYQGPLSEWRENINKPDNFLAAVDFSQIDKIEITKSKQTTTLNKQADGWEIDAPGNFYIQDSLASSLKTAMDGVKEAEIELVSSNQEKKADFQTDEATGTRVKLYQSGEQVADFIVGKMGPNYTTTYISQPDSANTYSIGVSLSVFNRSDWYDRTIFSTDRSIINKIRFQYPNREFTIEKKISDSTDDTSTSPSTGTEDEWVGTLPYNFDVSSDKINLILSYMSSLNAVEIPEQDFSNTGLDKNLIIIEATGEGINNTLMIGEAKQRASEDDAELYYAKRGDSDNIYLISKTQRDELDKQIWELR